MDVTVINPIMEAFVHVLPQIGLQKVEKKGLALIEADLPNPGVLINISVVGPLKGAILIGMSLKDAKQFASKMMMSMPVVELDSIAQSAISEMGNMVCANACTSLSKGGIQGLDIAPPVLIIGSGGQVKLPIKKALSVKLSADDILIDVNVGLTRSY